jgi:hypothetical protein
MNDLQTTIENLYKTFSKYTTVGIHHCECGCIVEDDVNKLSSKPLRKLEADDLISYHGRALYTWGDVEHYKHFLPRICELISVKRDFSYVTIDEFHVKLDYAEWTKWPKNEQQAIMEYIIADWIDFVNKQNSEIRDSEIGAYSKFFGLNEVLRLWQISKNQAALRNFVYFFYYHGSQILNGGLRIVDTIYKKEFLDWLKREELNTKLEEVFFQNEHTDPDYADKISIVLQMIEQEMKVNDR